MSYDDTTSQYIRGNQHKLFVTWCVVYTFIGIFCGWLGGIVMLFLFAGQKEEKYQKFILNNFYDNSVRSVHTGDTISLKKLQIFSLQPIITNFDSSPKDWLRLDIALICKDIPDKVFLETLHQDIMAYIRTVSIKQITGAQGFRYFKEDIEERVKLRSQGFVSSVIFRTFIIA
ncbi:flagellar basal body-associated FliL family protein [Candidatus Liberibacter asiaticus]|uniref:flagellar basal body-associated FliL family protein n=1 Tax=Liberibacter asiaticus TaxID=34021 RepID=UPI00234A4802|nr:flagellar basal body-associated FliL family protein [Candidatus Liberibacter asiaticus]WCM58663.1 flagellar basal body-associated FliL family protein [Candidatus Liberibacter asiaticus]